MDSALDFTRWAGSPRGVNYRRWVIASSGLQQLFRMKFFRALIFFAWFAGLLLALLAFAFSQTIATGGWLETAAADWGPRAAAMASAFTGMVLLYDDIVVQGFYTLIFWAHSYVGLFLSLIALTVLVPRLVARDRAGNALTMYLSRPLTALDYRLGKIAVIIGVLLALWTGPLLFGWVLSLLVAPDRLFMANSLAPVWHALVFNGVAIIALATIGFGIASVTSTTSSTVLLWIGMWIILATLAKFPLTPDWLRHASFYYDLQQIQRDIFQPGEALRRASEVLPMMEQGADNFLNHAADFIQARTVNQSWIGLAVLVAVSSAVFLRRLRPQ